jgi:DHA2 family multidrug resistance protein
MSDSTATPDDRSWRPRSSPWLIAVVVTLAAFMEILDTTIVNVSLPHIAGSLSTSYDDATWSLTSYLVANGIVLPISGAFGRILGRKCYFLLCIAGVTVCSFLCGISGSLTELIVFRLAQGFFGGGLQPNQQAIVLDTFEPAQRGRVTHLVDDPPWVKRQSAPFSYASANHGTTTQAPAPAHPSSSSMSQM